jgi:hypothetical protein
MNILSLNAFVPLASRKNCHGADTTAVDRRRDAAQVMSIGAE